MLLARAGQEPSSGWGDPFGELAGVYAVEVYAAIRQFHAEEVNLLAYSADHPNRFAKVGLRMTRRMRKRHKHLAAASPGKPDIVLHHGIAASKSVLDAQPLEIQFRRMPLLHRRMPAAPMSGRHNRRSTATTVLPQRAKRPARVAPAW